MIGNRADAGAIATGPTRAVQCIHCRAVMHVPQKAETATCPTCYKRQTVHDVVVESDRTGGRVETTGILFIKRKGRVWAPGVRAGDAVEVLGELKADVVTHGHVVIGETARWRGDCKAKILIVEDGARIDGGYFCIDPRGELQDPKPVPQAQQAEEEINAAIEPKADASIPPVGDPPTWAGAAI